MEAPSPSVGQQPLIESAGGVGQTQINAASSTANGPTSKATHSAAPEAEKLPRWQLDLIMEKIRRKSNMLKPLGETSKNIRQALNERRYFLDQSDRTHLQKCLDSLQGSIKVNSLQSMVERLEMVSRQLSLKFTPGATGNEWFISSDMFYLELLIDPLGIVQEVKIQHDGKTEQQNVPEMVDCLRRNDFTDFTAHLEGLVAIYQLNADKKIKSKAFIALQALEADLLAMSTTYSHMTDGEQIVMKSLLGLLQPRKGGHPVKLVYFISPYEFLDLATKTTLPTDVQTILEKKLGTIATVSIQSSTARKLQMSTTVSIVRSPDGKNIPRYGTLNATNSTSLPACFTVNLGKPVPICKDLLQAIQSSTGIHCFDFSNPQPILSLVTRYASDNALDCTNDRGVFVALPDKPDAPQVHCYFMTETPNLEGIMVSSINFTLASQLPQVVAILRQQLIFNTLVASCVRIGSKPEMKCIVFEVNALSHQNVSVSFQNPLEDSLVTLEFDLRDVSHPQCRLHAVTNAADIIPTLEEHACKVVQRSLSIPITVRAVIRRWQTMKSKFDPPNPEFTIPLGGSYGSDTISQLQSNEISCGAESERAQTHQQQAPSSSPMVPGVVMGLNTPNTTNININNVNNSNTTSLATGVNPNHSVLNSSNVNPLSSSGRHPSGSNSSSYTISPIHTNNINPSSGNVNTNFPTPNQSQNPVELLSSYMNPLFSLSNQLNMGGNLPGNFPNLSGLTLQNLQNLSGLLDQVGQRGRRRKRKGTSSDSSSTQPHPPGTGLNIQGNTTVPRPSPSPSPKSPRMLPNKSPKRRPSEGSDISDTSQGDNTRAPTPQTPVTPRGDGSNTAINLLMSEIGIDIPDARWNIDITPVGGTSGTTISSNPNSAQSIENFLASKLLSGFGTAAAAANTSNNTICTTNSNNSNLPSDFQIENFDSDMEIDTSEIGVSGFLGNTNANKFSMPQNKKLGGKKPRDFPKRSISLDSHSTMDDHLQSGNLQSFINSAAGSVGNAGQVDTSGVGSDFKPLVTPSLSITPVSTNSSMGQTTVNSLLAAIRPGIEIIPLPNPVQIPNSITVTPIHPKPMMQLTDNNNSNNKKSPSTTSAGGKDKKSTGDDSGCNSNSSEGNSGTTLKKKIGGAIGADGTTKKERKRKAPNLIPPLLDEEGLPVHDFNPGKQPKLLGPFGNVPNLNSPGGSFQSINDKKGNSAGMSVSLKGASPSFGGLNLKKPGSPSLNRAPTPNKSGSPTPKIGGKPSVSTLKSVSGSPKYPDVQSSSTKTSKLSKDRKTNSFQGNPKIAKNLSMVGNHGNAPNLMPTLKSLNDGSIPLSLASLNSGLLGLTAGGVSGLKADQAMAEVLMKANLLSKNAMEVNKTQMQPCNQNQAIVQSPAQIAQAAAASVAAQIQRSNSTGSNNGNSNNGASSGANNAAAAGAGNAGKKGGLLAVIDKLKSQHSGDDSSKKDMSKMDYLKASSAITCDVMQLTQQQKKNQNQGSGSSGSNGNTSGNSGNATSSNATGGNFSNNPEYMVKPGGQGLKMTLGKTKSSNSSTKLNAIKDKFKSGLKAGSKKSFSGVKLPTLAASTLSQQSQPSSLSSGSKITPGVTGVSGPGTNTTKKTSSSNSSSSSSGGNKNSDKDLSPSVENKTSSKSSKNSGSSSGAGSAMSGSKPRADDELDLTRILFQPGSGVFDAPKFDFTKYQIPKKSNNSTTGSGTAISGAGNSENSPKNNAAPSPLGSGTGNSKSDSKDSFSKELDKISNLANVDSPQQNGSNNNKVLESKESSIAKDKENPAPTTLHSSSVLDLPSSGSGNFGSSVLLSAASVALEPKNQPPGLANVNVGNQNSSESTKIILSSSSIGSSDISFSEVNKLFAKSSFGSVGSPINFSHSSNTLSSQSLIHNQVQGQGPSAGTPKYGAPAVADLSASVSFGEPDSTTNEMSHLSSASTSKKPEELIKGISTSATPSSMIKESTSSSTSIAVNKMQAPTFPVNTAGASGSTTETFVSPESPDPLNCIQDDVIYKNTLTIPTTPQNTVVPVVEETSSNAKESPALPSPDDDDQLIMDVAPEISDKKTETDASTSSSNASLSSISSNSNSVGNSNSSGIATGNPVLHGSASSLLSTFGRDLLEDTLSSKLCKESIFMPPPPVPDSTSSVSSSGFNSSTSGLSLTSSSTGSTPSITSNASISTVSVSQGGSSSGMTSNPLSAPTTTTVPIVSVHIVHSPQPNSPALLRSPLVVQSPHSSHASPYAIDDDLMDEALIGTGK